MRRAPSLCGLLAATALLLALVAASSQADVFGPISLVSTAELQGAPFAEQASVAEHSVIASEGRYVVYEGTFGGVTGIWRAELAGSGEGARVGTVEQVAGGDAELPSVSANGQYVSFTTNEGASLAAITDGRRDEQPHQEAVQVYVRNMAKAPQEEGSFIIASAATGQTQPLSYGEEAKTERGAVAAGRTAISSSGEYVAFVTTAISDLTDPQTPGEAKTPALQVAVRDIFSGETKLVSVEAEDGVASERPVGTVVEGGKAVGAAYQPVSFPATGAAAESQGASISADGNAVAWMGNELDKQVATFGGDESAPEYREPLWRSIQPVEPTRRITGGGDPLSPACLASGEHAPDDSHPSLSEPCQGPFEDSLVETSVKGVFPLSGEADDVPRMSANGQTVAFLASQRYIATGEEFNNAGESDDLYVVNMASGLSRVQALSRLTEISGGNANLPGEFAKITDFGVSSDGAQVAFSTLRTAFPLGSPAYVSAPEAVPATEELYDADLADGTLTRVTHGYAGEGEQTRAPAPGAFRSELEAGSPSFTANGATLAFSSSAANLVFGEGTKASSVFVVSRKQFESEQVQQIISPAPPQPALEPVWLLSVTARSLADGSVTLEVLTPGAGRLGAVAQSPVRVSVAASRASRARGRRAKRAQRGRTTSVVDRNVAGASASAVGEGPVKLVMTLSSQYRALAAAQGGLEASVTLTFSSPGHATLHDTVPVLFARTIRPAKRANTRAAKAGRRSKARRSERRR
jgi:hypothetical protein